ncbi:MAG: antitoxin [Desulfobacteraceae bacterium]|nr:MAG: antitoxin [Desulfobacteraceae bacterium]
MRKEYDFSKAKKNPYAGLLKKQITIRIGQETIDYFKSLAQKTGIPYQTLIDMYLSDCAAKKTKPVMKWIS